MLKREEQKLAEQNLGKIREHKKTLKQSIKPDFAYSETIYEENQGGGIYEIGESASGDAQSSFSLGKYDQPEQQSTVSNNRAQKTSL